MVVTDKTGKPILSLKQNNFTVLEDGKPQEITDFSATTAPFEVTLLLDTSGSARADLDLIKRSAQNFINSLRPGDRVSIIAFKTETKDKRVGPATDLVIGLTDDRAALKPGTSSRALDRVGTRALPVGGVNAPLSARRGMAPGSPLEYRHFSHGVSHLSQPVPRRS
jgi:Ca-activated chloride channel family protein